MKNNSSFDRYYRYFQLIRHTDNDGNEYWKARELSKKLDYSEFRNFIPVINKAKEACANSGIDIEKHFEDHFDKIQIGFGAKRSFHDVRLSRYACYLILQNADPSKEVVAHGQTYFAIQTRRQELHDEQSFKQLSENERRVMLRNELSEHNKALTKAARQAGVETHIDYAIFQDHGYKGLYGGLSAKNIHNRKKLNKNQKILDYMGSTELAANLFRATQTEDKLRKEQIIGKDIANATHYEVGQKVRKTIGEIGGVMPEKLPTPDKSIKQIEREQATTLLSNFTEVEF